MAPVVTLVSVTCVLLAAVVTMPVGLVPHCTVAPETKFVPLTVRVKADPPAVVEVGDRPVIVGATAVMVNVAPADVPPELVTVTVAEPGAAIRFAGTTAVNCVALT